MTRRDFILYLHQNGCSLLGEAERHSWWERGVARASVPRHADLSAMLVQKICRDLGVEPPK